MSRRTYVDVARFEERQVLNGIRKINSDFRVRIAPDTEKAIALIAEWKKTGKVPDGMNLPAMEALYGISLIRRNVEAVLRKQATPASNGHVTPSASVTDDTLLTLEQVRERNEAMRRYREFMQKLIDIVTNPEELRAWALFGNRYSSPPTESALRKIAAICDIASRIPGGPAILQAQHRNVRWAALARAVSQARDSEEFAWIAEQADTCATNAGLTLRFGAPGTEETYSFLNDCSETVRRVLVESGLAEDLRAHYEKFTCGSNVRLSQDAAQRYARAVDTLRHSDPHGLAALRKHFRTLPWDFVDDFTEEGAFVEPAAHPAQTPAIPTTSATERFIHMGLERNLRDAAGHGTHVAEGSAHTQHEAPTADSSVTSKEEPVSQPTEDTLGRAYLQKKFGDADRVEMAAVMATEDGLMEEISAVEELLNDPSIAPQVRQRVLSHMQTYAAKLVEAVAQHGRERLEMYFHLSEETVSQEADGAAPGSATEASIVIATDERQNAPEPEGAVAPIPLEEHDPRLAGFVPVLQKMEDAERDACDRLLRTLKPATERTRGRVPDRHRDTCFQLLDLLPSEYDPQLLFDYLKVTGDQVRGWRRGAIEKKTSPAAPVAATPQQLLDTVTDTSHRAEVEEMLPFLDHAATRSRGRISDDNQRRVVRMLELLPAETATSFLAYVKVSAETAEAWKRGLVAIGAPAQTTGTEAEIEAVPLEEAETPAVAIEPNTEHEEALANLVRGFQGETREKCLALLRQIPLPKSGIQRRRMTDDEKKAFLTASAYLSHLRMVGVLSDYFGIYSTNKSNWEKKFPDISVAVPATDMLAGQTQQGDIPAAQGATNETAVPHKRKKFRLKDILIHHRAAQKNNSSAVTEQVPISEPATSMTVESKSASTKAESAFVETEPDAAPDHTMTQGDSVTIAKDPISAYPFLRKVMDPTVQADCYTLLQSLQLPAKEPGKKRKLDNDTKRLIIRIADILAGYRAVSPFLESIDIADANLINWRAQLNLKPLTPLSETNDQAEPTAALAQNASHDENGDTPAPRQKTAKVTAAAPRLLPEDRQVTFVNSSLAPRPKSAADAFDETARDGRNRATRLAIVRGALERKNDPAARDRWYAEHSVSGSDVIRWMRVYGDLMGEERQTATKGSGDPRMKAEKHRAKEGLLQFKPGNHYGSMESFVDDVTAILLNPFDDFTHMAAKYDVDFMGSPDNRELHRRLLASTMNTLSAEEVRSLRAIVQTRPEDCEPEDLNVWREGIAKRFGLGKNVDTEEFAYALLEALRDPRQQAAMREAAMSAFS